MLSNRRLLRRVRWVLLAALLLLLAGVAVMEHSGVKGHIVMATGGAGGAYQALALRYQKDLAPYGVRLELRPKVEGLDTLKGLFPQYRAEFKDYNPANADIQAGIIKGGFVESLHGRLATEREQVWHQRTVDQLRGIGRLFLEPIWVFTRNGEGVTSLRELKGKRIYVGTVVGGSRRVTGHLLKANGVTEENATLIQQEFPEDASPLLNGKADAAILIAPSEQPKIQSLLRNRRIQLMDFAQEADAYVNRFPSLTKVVLRDGAVEFDPETPTADITLISTSAALVVRTELNPSLASLLAYVVIQNPKSGFDQNGDPILFYKAGDFPHGRDPEFDLYPSARTVYGTGELPVLLRTVAPMVHQLGLPFWVSAFVNEHGSQTLLLLIPLLSVLVPLFHYLPSAYRWLVRRKLLYWYEKLKALEASLEGESGDTRLKEKTAELELIEEEVSRIKVPLPFSDQLYELRGHVELVRRRLRQRLTDMPDTA